MKYYFAPMEGITGYVYRSVHHKFFSGIDKYFTPFLSPGPKKVLTDREIRDILPKNNPQMYVVPQILTNRAEDFIRVEKELESYGYREVNFNLGCPSGTVTAKKKRSRFSGIYGRFKTVSGRGFSEALSGNFHKNQNRKRGPGRVCPASAYL